MTATGNYSVRQSALRRNGLFKRDGFRSGKMFLMKHAIYFPDKFLVDDFLRFHLTGEQSIKTVVAAGVSGGKDSISAVIEIDRFLRSIDFRGRFVLIHSDLGEIEHTESGEWCRRLARHVNRELIVVYPPRTMLERWEYRWTANSNRFINLERVKLVSPWSGPGAMRFCTSDEKVTPITSALKSRFPKAFIINAVGLRRDESKSRAKKPIWKENEKLKSVELATSGIDWHPILDYSEDDVFGIHELEDFERHPAYVRGNSRVSCSFCVLASTRDLEISLRDERNLESFRRIINLEFTSTYSFRNDSFLAEIGFHYLTVEEKDRFQAAREKQIKRLMLEKEIPSELLYVENFPAFQPDISQSGRLAEIRAKIGELYGFKMKYINARDVYDRYAELIVLREIKEAKKQKKKQRQEMRAAKIQKNDINILKNSILADEASFEQLPLF